MRIPKIIAFLCLIAMTIGLLNGFLNGDFFEDGKELLENPWGVMSMIDLYVGFVLFSMWIAYREKSVLVTIVWFVLMMTLGFFTGSLYVFIALVQSKEDWKVFFMGSRS